MAKKNDKVILELKQQIEDKKKALKSSERFSPITNCSLTLDGERVNLHAAGVDTLTLLLVKLNTYKKSAEELNLFNQLVISGFSIQDWMTDISSKLTAANRTQEEARLKILETKLHDLLSVEKKTELAIDELKAMIN